jgi:hypothetical protein
MNVQAEAQLHRRVPRQRVRNLRFRRFVLLKCQGNVTNQRAFFEACKSDPLFFINAFVWQFNPNTIGTASPELGPFLTWDFQEEAVAVILACIRDRKDLIIEKSREMGASWLCLLIIVWFLLFHPWKKFLLISRNEEAVDRSGDPDCLFWKVDFILDHLPDWLRRGVVRRRMGYVNTLNHSSVTGQASTGKAGVGGRATAMFIDEFSQIKDDYDVLHRTSDTTGCRIFNGTHLGLDTAFYELAQRPDMRKLRMHWTQHPDKVRGLYHYDDRAKRVLSLDPQFQHAKDFNFVLDGKLRSPWYDEQCRRKGSPRAIAMDLDINPQGSVSQFVDSMVIRTLIERDTCPPYWEGKIDYDHESATPDPLPLVQEPGGLLKLWLIPDADGRPPRASYAAGTDLAEGTGSTPSCLSMVNSATGEKVLEYADRWIKPEEFAVLVVALCRLFADRQDEPARLAWEMVGPGDRFGTAVIQTGFRNVYYRVNEATVPWLRKTSDVPGWFPTPQNRTRLLGEYRSALYSRQFVNRSEYALKEFTFFRYSVQGHAEYGGSRGDDYSSGGINHGDIVIADALAWKMRAGSGLASVKKKDEPEQPKVGSLAWRRLRNKQRRQAQERW